MIVSLKKTVPMHSPFSGLYIYSCGKKCRLLISWCIKNTLSFLFRPDFDGYWSLHGAAGLVMKRLIIRGVGLVLREANSSECFCVQDFLTSPSTCGTKQKRVPFWKSWFQRWIILSYFSTIITWKHSKAGKQLIDWALLDAICFFLFLFFPFFSKCALTWWAWEAAASQNLIGLRMFMDLAGYGGDSNVGRHKLQRIIWPHDRWLWCCLL